MDNQTHSESELSKDSGIKFIISFRSSLLSLLASQYIPVIITSIMWLYERLNEIIYSSFRIISLRPQAVSIHRQHIRCIAWYNEESYQIESNDMNRE